MPLYPPATGGTGTGDVVGPASSVDNIIPLYSGTTGKLLKSSTLLGTLNGSSHPVISPNTSDTNDNRVLHLAGGGLDSSIRGGYMYLSGNESGGAGSIGLVLGDVTGSSIRFGDGTGPFGYMHKSGGFSWGDSNDPGDNNIRILGTSTLVGAVTLSSTLNVAGVTTFSNHVLFSPDNTYNIGAAGATRPANIWVANNLNAGGSISAVNASATNLTITGGNISLNTGTVISSDIVFSGSRSVRTNTSDGSDTNAAYLTGAGGIGAARGSYVASYGNEFASAPGTLQLGAGNSATGGHIDFYTDAGIHQGRMWKSGGFSWGETSTDPLDNNVRFGGSLTVASTVTGGTYNGQTISSAASFTGNVSVAGNILGNGGVCALQQTTNYTYFQASNNGGLIQIIQDNVAGNGVGLGAYAASIYVTHGNGLNIIVSSGNIKFYNTTSSVRMTLFNSGCLGIGTAPVDIGANCFSVTGTSYIYGHIHTGYYLYPGATTSPGTIQGTYFFAAHSTYGLYTSHGLYVNGGITVNGGIVGAAGSTWTQGTFGAGNKFFYQLDGAMALGVSGTSTQTHNSFWNANGQVGQIYSSGTSTTYQTSSDARLKEDLGLVTDTSVLINTRIHDFKWKTDGTFGRGVFAQEALEVNPAAIGIGDDELNAFGYPKRIWGVDYSRYVPDLIVGWQEHEARIRSLEEMVKGIE